MRIQLIGCSGSGKTTWGQALAERLRLPFVDLDDLYWEPGWVGVGHTELERRLQKTLALEHWVIAGNYGKMTERVLWPRLSDLVILDPPLITLLLRSTRRTAQRILTGERCCNGNRETLWHAMGHDSVLRYTLRVWKDRHARYGTLPTNPALAHAQVHHLKTDDQVRRWFETKALA